MPKISAPTLEKHRAETIDRLLDAWGELIMTRGYAEVSLADVAGRAGLARTAIYNYFPDRESLLFAWTDREVARTIAELESEVASAPTYADKLRVFIRMQFVGFATRHLPPGQEVAGVLPQQTFQRFMDHIEPLERIAREIVEEGARAGEFAGADADAAVPMIMACIGTERVPIATRAHDVDEATERVTPFLLRALGHPG